MARRKLAGSTSEPDDDPEVSQAAASHPGAPGVDVARPSGEVATADLLVEVGPSTFVVVAAGDRIPPELADLPRHEGLDPPAPADIA